MTEWAVWFGGWMASAGRVLYMRPHEYRVRWDLQQAQTLTVRVDPKGYLMVHVTVGPNLLKRSKERQRFDAIHEMAHVCLWDMWRASHESLNVRDVALAKSMAGDPHGAEAMSPIIGVRDEAHHRASEAVADHLAQLWLVRPVIPPWDPPKVTLPRARGR